MLPKSAKDDRPFPIDRPGDDDDFVIHATGLLTIPPGEAGDWTFGVNLATLPVATLIPTGETWRYLADGSDQGVNPSSPLALVIVFVPISYNILH